jgi:two-component system chemotaxis response regulator CheB
MKALKYILPALPKNFRLPVIIVQHIGAHSDNTWINLLNANAKLKIKEADEKETIKPGNVYIAPPNYHLLIEKDKTFSLSIEARVNYARPSINVLFESAAEAYGDSLIGIVLTGSSNDGASGLKTIKEAGGLAIAQDPSSAESSFMPAAAIAATGVDHILTLDGIKNLLVKICNFN